MLKSGDMFLYKNICGKEKKMREVIKEEEMEKMKVLKK